MHLISSEDILRGLESFRAIAKQDLLAAQLTENPDFWEKQASTRRNTYDRLISVINNEGVESAIFMAKQWYQQLPNFYDKLENSNPEDRGTKQALEIFFRACGVEKKEIKDTSSSIRA
ncbi:MAG: hypothetical protein BWY00_00520 [Firmicutes bacterium ADurb.Bin153]|nr:MAG: hypothetical protein BWY00_00520 [Firmicutes bacterium ADurb.Bin153]